MVKMLNIYHICNRSSALGPGKRYVFWVQGCLQNCKGCISPQSRPLTENMLIGIDKMAADIIATKDIDGITISGGEPFLQATNLSNLLQIVKGKRPELTVLVFTGYTIEQLSTDKAKRFMTFIDLLIDGPYIDHLNDESGLRGSSNQRFHYLTNRLLPYKDEMERGGRNNEIVVTSNGMHIIGIPRKDTSVKSI